MFSIKSHKKAGLRSCIIILNNLIKIYAVISEWCCKKAKINESFFYNIMIMNVIMIMTHNGTNVGSCF